VKSSFEGAMSEALAKALLRPVRKPTAKRPPLTKKPANAVLAGFETVAREGQ